MSEARGNVFNVGSDRSVTIRELAEIVLRVTASRATIELVPYAEAFASGFEDLRQRRPDLTRIRRVIAFDPSISLEKTIEDIATQLRRQGA
jgi:UDP-glucose 4-epimerase